MKPLHRVYCLLLLLTISVQCVAMQAKREIVLWHSMAGSYGSALQSLVHDFNESQPQYHVNAVYKGDYQESLTSAVAAFRAGKQPDIIQVFEVGTGTLIKPQGVIVPLHALLTKHHIDTSSMTLLPSIRAYYSDEHNNMLALPFNSSAPVLYYNRQRLVNDTLPRQLMWPSIANIKTRGASCTLTTAWPSWTQIENLFAWHNKPFCSQANGYLGTDVKLSVNAPLLKHHLSTLRDWQRRGIFRYGGRRANANVLFTSGQCAMIIDSSGMMQTYKQLLGDKLGVSAIPYWPHVANSRRNTIVGGGALWVFTRAKRSAQIELGIAKFLAFMSSSTSQAFFIEKTGYLPTTLQAHQYLVDNGYYQRHPESAIAYDSLAARTPTSASRGIRLGNFMQIRAVLMSALEGILSGQYSTDEALQEATVESNLILERHHRNVS